MDISPVVVYTVNDVFPMERGKLHMMTGMTSRNATIFRTGRTEVPKLPLQQVCTGPADSDIHDYTDEVFRMYNEPEENDIRQNSMEISRPKCVCRK